jgi:hypothetical protein
VLLPADVDMGSKSNRVPTIAAAPNAITTICVGCMDRLRPNWFTLLAYASCSKTNTTPKHYTALGLTDGRKQTSSYLRRRLRFLQLQCQAASEDDQKQNSD